jgi:acyl-coenzyme A thioesterase PaaI-like protein
MKIARPHDAPPIDPVHEAITQSARDLATHLVTAEPADDVAREVAELVARAVALLETQPRTVPNADSAQVLREAHWTATRRGPFIGRLNPVAPPITVSEADGLVTGWATYGAAFEGPPNCVHGGMIAAGFDEVLGFCQGFTARPGMTGTLNVTYRSPTPLHQLLRYSARVDRIEGRKIFVKGDLRVDADGRLCAEADGLFITIDGARFSTL